MTLREGDIVILHTGWGDIFVQYPRKNTEYNSGEPGIGKDAAKWLIGQKVVLTEDLPVGENLILAASFEKDGEVDRVATGMLTLFHDDREVGSARRSGPSLEVSIAGEGLTIGRDSGAPVTGDYPGTTPWPFRGGTIRRVRVDVSGQPYVDLEREAQAMLMRGE